RVTPPTSCSTSWRHDSCEPGRVSAVATTFLTHARVKLALHELRGPTDTGSNAPPLLLLHELGGASPTEPRADEAAWPGPIFALDFTGHGASTIPRGGGYH